MFLPYSVDVPMARIPFANWAIIVITTLISLAILGRELALQNKPRDQGHDLWQRLENKQITPEEFERELQSSLHEMDDPLLPLALNRDDFSPLQLFSHLFVHGDFWHLLGKGRFGCLSVYWVISSALFHSGIAYIAHVVGGLAGMAITASLVAKGWFKPARRRESPPGFGTKKEET